MRLKMKEIIFSAMRPTGAMHLGNYFGALENWVKLQNDYDCYFAVADWHALTTGYEDTDAIKGNIKEMIIDWLSAGLDPDKCTMFVQSSVKEHAELHLLLSMITPLSWLLRCPTYKEQISQMSDKNITTYGFLGYPCLQTADILLYNTNCVPVGEDQLPHIELAREIARRFNYIYGETFREPQSLLTKAKVLPGLDGRKMSKSYNNTIALSDSQETVVKKVRTMITDPARIKKDDKGHPDICTVFTYHKMFSSEEEVKEIEECCKQGKIGCVACKKKLAENVIKYLEPMYIKRQEILKTPDIIDDILHNGQKKAQNIASKNLKMIKEAMKLNY